jgi:predicted alpha/beta-hydrolase family hydrolase
VSEPVRFQLDGGEVSGAWHRPRSEPRAALVLGHGAGSDLNAKLLIDVGDTLAQRDIAVVRFNFPYSEAGRKAPDRQPALEACWRAVAETVAKEVPRPWLGGKSMGGRIASHIVAEGFDASGLIFLGYPLHPPGKPERIRDAHLRDVRVPMLFLQGTRDPFATPDLLHKTIAALPNATLVEIEGGDHSFKVSGRKPVDVTAQLIDETESFITRHS